MVFHMWVLLIACIWTHVVIILAGRKIGQTEHPGLIGQLQNVTVCCLDLDHRARDLDQDLGAGMLDDGGSQLSSCDATLLRLNREKIETMDLGKEIKDMEGRTRPAEAAHYSWISLE